MAMIAHSTIRQYARVMRHVASTRATEVLVLQGSPILGIVLGGYSPAQCGVFRLCLLIFGSLALTTHIFVFNDWAGTNTDVRDPRRMSHTFVSWGIGRDQIARVAIALLIFANVAFAVVGNSTVLFAAFIATLSLLYSCSSNFGKNTPVMASINHLLGGALHFLLGYTLCRSLDTRGLVISLFFGLVFAGGHLNQQVRDYEGDFLNGLRTSAVVFGCRSTFLASLFTFTLAYVLLACLAEVGYLPRQLAWVTILWLLQVGWSLSALKHGLGFETAVWMQRRYRLLFVAIGLAMFIR